jgi:hypothetical protein
MEATTLKNAILESERFIRAARKVKIKKITGTHSMAGKTWDDVEEYTKETATCKRASMDLTRILADLRLGR